MVRGVVKAGQFDKHHQRRQVAEGEVSVEVSKIHVPQGDSQA
jgi:hypothetical protein